MASLQKSHPKNVLGSLFTDTTCIDCGTCFHLAPELFKENPEDDKSIVVRQPVDLEDWQKAKRAILSCPTVSIGVHDAPESFKSLPTGLPLFISDTVCYLGHTARESFGATSYLILRPEGNVLVDSPRFHPSLVKELERLGGVKFMFLSHQDDVADHEKFHQHFQAERIIHEADVSDDTKHCEMILTGESDIQLRPDLKVLMTPGHTKGHMCLLYKDEFLFSGDHLFTDGLRISSARSVCWYSWDKQILSTEKLLKEKFAWLMPGHGGWGYFGVEQGRKQLARLVQEMKGK